MRLVRLPRFDLDIEEIYSYLSNQNPTAAEAFFQRVDDAVLRLEAFPFSGRSREDLWPGMRTIIVQGFGHLLFHQVTDDEIILIRAIHGARDLPAVLRED